MDLHQVFNADGSPAIGERAILDVNGNPMVFPNGDPIAFRLGFTRVYNFYGVDPIGFHAFKGIARDAGICITKPPQLLFEFLWKDLPDGSNLARDPVSLWMDAIFELAWREIPGVPLVASEKSAWSENVSVAIRALSKFRHLIPEQASGFKDPPDHWYSIIDDVFTASIAAIDVLLTVPTASVDPSSSRSVVPSMSAHDAHPDSANAPNNNDTPVVLNGQGEAVFVFGITKPPLTHPQYNVVQALLEAGDAGLGKDRLVQVSGHSDARGILNRLAKLDGDWARAIQMPGKPNGRYRIRTAPR